MVKYSDVVKLEYGKIPYVVKLEYDLAKLKFGKILKVEKLTW